MSATKENLTTDTLLVKNLPLDMNQLTDVLTQLRSLPSDIRPFGRRRALLRYSSHEETRDALQQFQGLVAQNRPIVAKFFYKEAVREHKAKDESQRPRTSRKIGTLRKSTQTTGNAGDYTPASLPAISNYVRKLYACNANLDFNQPPPPYLRYAYPRITPAILDSISIALMSNTRFYTQVLHLMNRMNLEPPFGPRQTKFVPPGEPRDTSTQTERVHIEELPPQQAIPDSDEESELESSGNEQEASREVVATRAKRKQTTHEEQYRKRARLLLQATLFKKQKSKVATVDAAEVAPLISTPGDSSKKLLEVFESPVEVRPTKIAVHLKPKTESAAQDKEVISAPIKQSLEDLGTHRLSEEELKMLPVFKNYTEGAPSNKLYIKNLAKEVSADDLYSLYSRYTATDQLEVKVMQQGRMKGQAFVTFTNLSDEAVVGVALRETNGFILKQKPMVVCFGRK